MIMLNENQLKALAEPSYKRIHDINSQYLQLIGKKIGEIGTMSKTDLIRLQNIKNFSRDVYEIERALTIASGKTVNEIENIMQTIAMDNYNFSSQFFTAKGIKQIPFEENEYLQKYIKSIAKQTAGQHINLTQHTAFMVFGEDGEVVPSYFQANKNKVPTSLSDTYTNVIDNSVTKAQLGLTDYQSAMRETIKALSDSGIRTVDYATGYSRRLDTAVRQNVLWGIKQCNQGVADLVGDEFGADGYEISYHSNPRPSHAPMGGKQYAKGKSRTVSGVHYPSFGEVEGLLQDFGCLHFKFSILLGISSPTYSPSQLEQFKKSDNQKIEFEGKEYTKYELSQLQRKTETTIRHAKDRQIAAKASGDDTLRRQEQGKINVLTNKYAKLCKESGLPSKAERMSVSGFRKVKTENELIKNHLKNSAGHSIIKVDKVKLTGEPNSITQIVGKKGGIERNYYDSNGRQYKQISNHNHGNAKQHLFGKNGEHAHDYVYDENGKLIRGRARQLTSEELKKDGDIFDS